MTGTQAAEGRGLELERKGVHLGRKSVERRIRSFFRHERMAVRSVGRGVGTAIILRTVAVPSPLKRTILCLPRYAATAASPMVEYVDPAPVVTYAAPAPVIEYIAP